MSARISNSPQLDSGSFELVRNSMLQSDDLPLAEVVEANQWQSVFDEHEIDFGSDEDAVYTPAITLWALISQAFFKGEMRSCKAAVGRVAALWATLGKRLDRIQPRANKRRPKVLALLNKPRRQAIAELKQAA